MRHIGGRLAIDKGGDRQGGGGGSQDWTPRVGKSGVTKKGGLPKRHIAPGCALVSGHGSVVDSIRISRARSVRFVGTFCTIASPPPPRLSLGEGEGFCKALSKELERCTDTGACHRYAPSESDPLDRIIRTEGNPFSFFLFCQ